MRGRFKASSFFTAMVVLTAVVGGQVALWWHVQRRHADSSVEVTAFDADQRSVDLNGRASGNADVSPLQLSATDRSTPRDLQYFPDAVRDENIAGQTEQGVAYLAASDESPLGGQETSSPTEFAPPEAIMPPVDATPIHNSNTRATTEKREIIERLLPDATAEEQEIWLEELEGLPPDAIEEILKLRSRLGLSEGLTGPLVPEIPSTDPLNLPVPNIIPDEPTDAESLYDSTTPTVRENHRLGPVAAAYGEVRDAVINNIANAATVGFRRTQVILEDSPYQLIRPGSQPSGVPFAEGYRIGLGVRVASTFVDQMAGDLRETGQPFHVAIAGHGFFHVTHLEQSLYTRCGAFVLNGDSQLAFVSGDRLFTLQPTITLPEDAVEIKIAVDGTVSVLQDATGELTSVGQITLTRFVNPAGLAPVGGSLLAQTAASGKAVAGIPGQSGRGTVRQGLLEESNVNIERELAVLKQLQRQLTAIEEAMANFNWLQNAPQPQVEPRMPVDFETDFPAAVQRP